jgi:K+/H+ antiporter YhaU regulatory subunit KhtT
VVAVERADELIVEFGADFRFQRGDALYVCGSAKATERFCRIFPQE